MPKSTDKGNRVRPGDKEPEFLLDPDDLLVKAMSRAAADAKARLKAGQKGKKSRKRDR